MNRTLVALSLAAAGALFAGSVDARTWQITPDYHSETMAQFHSKATIVKFTGRTTKVDGHGEINVSNPSLNPKGEIRVDLASLDTGIVLRNEHMRGMIEAAKYPSAVFKLKKLNAPKLVANQPVEGTVEGEFTLHGVTRPVKAPVSLTFLPEQDKEYRAGDWVAVSTEFKAKLSDYGISLPKGVLGMKVSDELTLQFDGMAKGI